MRRALAPLLGLLALLTLGACHTAKPAIQNFANVTYEVADTPDAVVDRLRTDASAAGYDVWMDGPRTVRIDFGVQNMRVPVPTEYGLWGTRVSFRDTQVRSSAVYSVGTSAAGSLVTLANNPVYWHPDIGVWLPGPYDVSPGAEMLNRLIAN